MKTVLITGANRGIGLEHVRRFAERHTQVLAAVRSPEDAVELRELADARGNTITILPYDAADPAAPAGLKTALGDTPIDLLFANAGVMGDRKDAFGSVNVEQVVHHVRVNSLAPLKLAEALADNVANSEKRLIACQSSLMGSIGDNGSGGYYAYRVSKAALNMVAKSMSNDLRSRGVITVALHPGWVKTRMGGASAPVTVAQCVAGQQALFDRLTLADSGHFFNYDGLELPW
jgi:NAD(P)-dependent dehydrogenase (short-subunit alcohol dehydrogenase family)